jgi:hypothetical protein
VKVGIETLLRGSSLFSVPQKEIRSNGREPAVTTIARMRPL